ncbi:MAG: DUF4437 domain-containing protein [Bacteroidota bacterium]
MSAVEAPQAAPATLLLAADIEWSALNPARGANSPRAANLWGDRTTNGATGFLVRFKEGFSSPPHIHNVSYRAIVMEGEVHNDDPEAANLWMPPGSYWTQPSGEVHITSARATENMAYVEIDSGPYLVQPTEEAFDNGERPINIHADNLVWLKSLPADISVNSTSAIPTVEIAHLYQGKGIGDVQGAFLKLPAGFSGTISAKAAEFTAVLILGAAEYRAEAEAEKVVLDPGATLTATERVELNLSADEAATFYLRWR